jgi:HlyD family secretion protein
MAMRKTFTWGIMALAVVAAVAIGLLIGKARQGELPKGLASGNGRLEAKLIDIGAKEPLRVLKVLVDEGAVVKPGQVLAQLDTTTIEAELASAKENIAVAEEKLQVAQAGIVRQRSEVELADIESGRSTRLVADGAGSQRELDVRKAKLETAKASLEEAQATLRTAEQGVAVARANAATVQTRIDDATLKSPILGRVLYRLAEPGEVLAAGGKALTLVDLEDVYMEIFLPSEQAASVPLDGEGRITLDYAPGRAIAGHVSFVSPEAQFTPKQVETRSEREKLMFRVKIQVPEELMARYVDRVKTGVRGVGYVKTDPQATWPAWLQNVVAP